MSLNVRVITPDKVVWDAVAEELILPSSTGQIGILTDHAPLLTACLLYTSPSPRDVEESRMPSSA